MKGGDVRNTNQNIAVRFRKVATLLDEAEDVAGLFETLFAGIEREFAVPFVWLTLMDMESAAPLIAAIESSPVLRDRMSIVTEEYFRSIIPGRRPVLINENLQPFYKLLPPNNKYFIRSLAVVPFEFKKEIVGSWNNGDAYAGRFSPDMGSELLQILSGSLSRRLSKLVAESL